MRWREALTSLNPSWLTVIGVQWPERILAVMKMASKGQAARTTGSNRLDSKAYLAMFKETRELADKVLERYGEPDMSLAELRQILAERLPDFSLSDWLIKEREAGW